MTLRGPSIAENTVALFLDVDGTLLELAPTPDTVRVPAALRNTLQLAAERERGALALVSGRSIAELDRLFAPCVFPAAGQHGFERRGANGVITKANFDERALHPSREALVRMQEQHAGLLLEDKGAALAMHFRLAPHCESTVRTVMTRLAAQACGKLQLRCGKCVLELAPAGYSKRAAVEAFMAEAPFAGSSPVFVGDDVADEDGFAAVNALGGYSIRVGHTRSTAARYSFGSVSAVIAWLRERNISGRSQPTAMHQQNRKRRDHR